MNILQRTSIEKTDHENGFENILPGTDDWVLLDSARHRVHVAPFHSDEFLNQN